MRYLSWLKENKKKKENKKRKEERERRKEKVERKKRFEASVDNPDRYGHMYITMYPLKPDKNHVSESQVFVDRFCSHSIIHFFQRRKLLRSLVRKHLFREITLSTSRNLAPDDRWFSCDAWNPPSISVCRSRPTQANRHCSFVSSNRESSGILSDNSLIRTSNCTLSNWENHTNLERSVRILKDQTTIERFNFLQE